MQKQIEIFLSTERTSALVLDSLLKEAFQGTNPEAAALLLKSLAATPEQPVIAALHGYRGMRSVLSEADESASATVRKERLKLYKLWSELFQTDLKNTVWKRFVQMAMATDWSPLATLCGEAVGVHQTMLMLWFAGLLYRWRIPGTLRLCDAAACSAFALLTQRTAERSLESAA